VASAGQDETFRLPTNAGQGPLRAVALGSRFGQRVIITGGGFGPARAWEAETGQPITLAITVHQHGVEDLCVAQIANKSVVISLGYETAPRPRGRIIPYFDNRWPTIWLWDLESGDSIEKLDFPWHITTISLAKGRDRQILWIKASSCWYAWDVNSRETRELVALSQTHTFEGSLLAAMSGSSTDTLLLYDWRKCCGSWTAVPLNQPLLGRLWLLRLEALLLWRRMRYYGGG
jgi:hypothetical protein